MSIRVVLRPQRPGPRISTDPAFYRAFAARPPSIFELLASNFAPPGLSREMSPRYKTAALIEKGRQRRAWRRAAKEDCVLIRQAYIFLGPCLGSNGRQKILGGRLLTRRVGFPANRST